MNDVMERTATSYAVIDAVDNKASDCRGMLKSLVDATNGITGPQAGLLGCLVVSIAGVAGYGIYALCDLVKSGHPVELELRPITAVNPYSWTDNVLLLL